VTVAAETSHLEAYRLLRTLEDGSRPAEELYDITTDPYQLNNLAADPNYTDRSRRDAGRALLPLQQILSVRRQRARAADHDRFGAAREAMERNSSLMRRRSGQHSGPRLTGKSICLKSPDE